MTYYLGIDPGKTGGWAVVNEEGTLIDTGVFASDKMAHAFRVKPVLVGIENVHAFPKQGVSGVFTFGQNVGYWQGWIDAQSLPYIQISPVKWRNSILDSKRNTPKKPVTNDKEAYQALKARKQATVSFVNRLFPGHAIKHDGIADAICIALYTRKYDRSGV